jgi:hypothetical protein
LYAFLLLYVLFFLLYLLHGYKKQTKRGDDSTASSDVKNAYTASQAYFTDYPGGTVSLSKLTSYAYVQSSEVTLTVISGSQTNLQLTASHANGSKTYTINSGGELSF